jgi:hypothetical protein
MGEHDADEQVELVDFGHGARSVGATDACASHGRRPPQRVLGRA